MPTRLRTHTPTVRPPHAAAPAVSGLCRVDRSSASLPGQIATTPRSNSLWASKPASITDTSSDPRAVVAAAGKARRDAPAPAPLLPPPPPPPRVGVGPSPSSAYAPSSPPSSGAAAPPVEPPFPPSMLRARVAATARAPVAATARARDGHACGPHVWGLMCAAPNQDSPSFHGRPCAVLAPLSRQRQGLALAKHV